MRKFIWVVVRAAFGRVMVYVFRMRQKQGVVISDIQMVSLVSGFCLEKEPRINANLFRSHNRIFLASGLKFAYRKFFNAPPGKMLASGGKI